MLKKAITSVAVTALACAGLVAGGGAAHAAGSASGTNNGTTVTVLTADAITGWHDSRTLWPQVATIQIDVPAPFTDTSKYGSTSIEPVEWTAYVESKGSAGCSDTETFTGRGSGSVVYDPAVFGSTAPGTCSVSVQVVATRDTYQAAGDYRAELTVTGAWYNLLAYPKHQNLALSASTVSKGKAVVVSGKLAENWDFTEPAIPNATVRLQYLAAGSQTWADVAQTTTDAFGSWKATHAPASSGQYRAAYSGAGLILAGESEPISVTVTKAAAAKKKVKISKPKAPASVKRTATVKVTGKVTAIKSGKKYTGLKSKVTLQHKPKGKSFWYNVKSVKSNAKGAFTIKTKLAGSGQLRVVHKATNTYAKAKSSAVKITVR